jgi:hypothetical protein
MSPTRTATQIPMRNSQLPNFFIVYSIFHLPSFIRFSNGMVLFKFSPTRCLNNRWGAKNQKKIDLYTIIGQALTRIYCFVKTHCSFCVVDERMRDLSFVVKE